MYKKGEEFYLPYRAVAREGVESTEIHIAYDAPERANENSPSLKNCLGTGPPLQNHTWDILSRNRMHSWIASGDIQSKHFYKFEFGSQIEMCSEFTSRST